MIPKQFLLSQMGLEWAFPGRRRLGVIHLDLTCLKGIDRFLNTSQKSCKIGASPVKGDTLLLCPELERDFGYCHPISVFFLILHNMKKFGSLWAVV